MTRYQVTHPGFYIMSLVSLAILLVLIGFFMSGLFFSQQYAQEFRENINLVLELNPGFDNSKSAAIVEVVKQYEGVRPESVKFISREDAMQEMGSELGVSDIVEGLENPFLDMVEFSVLQDYLNEAFIDEMAAEFKRDLGATSLHHPQDFFGDVFALLGHLRIYILVLIAIALGLAGILIHHIMRLNVVAQQRQIRTMELVGAKTGFIIRPFVLRGLQMAILAWGIAILLSLVIWFGLMSKPQFYAFATSWTTGIGALAMLFIAALICVFSTWIAVAKSIGGSHSGRL